MRARPGAPRGDIPQHPDFLAADEYLDGMFNTGAIAVATMTSGSRRYTGSDLTPQLFLLPPAASNDNLDTAAQTSGLTRNVLNRRRGAGAR
jgi:hypothetical protein